MHPIPTKSSSCLPIFVVCLTATPVFAQSGTDDSLESLDPTVVTAEEAPTGADTDGAENYVNPELGLDSKLPYSSFETPRAVETVTREQFEERGAQNLEEAARYLAGVESGYYGLDTRQDFIRIRGLNSINYRDGLQHQYNFYNNTPQEAYAIEQVDFIKGPASILFGRGTVGGTVNTTSKIARPGAQSEIMAGYGSFDRFQAGVDFNQALDEDETLFFRLVGYYRNSDSYVDHVMDDAKFLMPSLTWQPCEDTSLSLLLNFQANESLPSLQFYPIEATQVPGRTLTNNIYGGEPTIDRYDTEQNSATLLFDHRFNETYAISSTLRWVASSADYVEHTLVPPSLGGLLGPALPPGTYHRILYGADHQTDVLSGNIVLEVNHRTGPIEHDIRLGTDLTRADRDRNTLPPNPFLLGVPYTYGGVVDLFNPTYGVNAYPLPTLSDNLSVTEELFGAFLSDRMQWNDLIVSLGVRYDHYEFESNQQPTEKQENWVFDAGIMYQLPCGISPYYSYAESFEPQGIHPVNNDVLDPKTGTQHEVGVKWMPSPDTLLVASYFQIEEDDRFFTDPLIGGQYSSVEVDGAEFSVRHRFHDFFLQAAYTYLDTANNDFAGSPRLSGVPEHQASSWITYRPQSGPLEGFRAGLGVRYTGTTFDGIDSVSTGVHTLVDAMIGYQWERFDIQLSASNLFNEQYIQTQEFSQSFQSTSTFLGQDRSINLVTRYSF